MIDDVVAWRIKLYDLLGDLPDRHRPISAKTVAVEEHEGYTLERLVLDLNGIEEVPALFVSPHRAGRKRLPTVLYNHAHGGNFDLGKAELIDGRGALVEPAYGPALAQAGCNALCIDAWNFGERRGRTESSLFKEMLWNGQVLWGMIVYDSLRALDYLVSRPDVDPARLGTLGLSMGSTMGWWTAALDERIQVTVDICCLTDFHSLIQTRGLDGHGIYYFVPRLLKDFTTARINALIAPRAHLSLAGNYDPLTPPAGLDLIDAELTSIYAKAHAPDAWQLMRFETGHFETAHMRHEIMEFLREWL